jgi:6-phosphogluconolactonase
MIRVPRTASALAGLVAALAAGCAAVGPQSRCAVSLVYVGTEGGAIHALPLDTCAGTLGPAREVARVAKPRWIAAHPQRPVVYVTSERTAQQGIVAAFTMDRATGSLSALNEAPSGGAGPTHLWLDAPSGSLLAANFGSGSVGSIALRADGSLGELVSRVQATGSGPHRRQASPHAHGAAVDPSGRFALVADLGADRLFVHPFDRASRRLKPDDSAVARAAALPPGSGPRHFVFDATGRHVHLLNELTAELATFGWDGAAGRLTLLQSQPISSAGFQGIASASGIALAPGGRHLYVADRGENTLVVYRLSPGTSVPALVQRLPAGGEAPWSFAIDPGGRWLLLANHRSHGIRAFAIDAASGTLKDTGQAIPVQAPWSVAIVP